MLARRKNMTDKNDGNGAILVVIAIVVLVFLLFVLGLVFKGCFFRPLG